MKFACLACFIFSFIPSVSVAQTVYGSCPERSDVYKDRFEQSGKSSDLVCMQHALERELSGQDSPDVYNCPRTSEFYQKRFESLGQNSDLVCMQTALERELM